MINEAYDRFTITAGRETAVSLLFATMLIAGAASTSDQVKQLRGAHPINRPYWVTDQDYPVDHKLAGRTSFTMVISPFGLPQRCSITESSGNDQLDQQTCELVMSRARFSAATDQAGQPLASEFRTAIVWGTDTRPAPPPTIDLELRVSHLPAGLDSPIQIFAVLAVEPDGKISDCGATRQHQPEELLTLACAKLTETYSAKPLLDEAGKPQRSLVGAVVEFSPDK